MPNKSPPGADRRTLTPAPSSAPPAQCAVSWFLLGAFKLVPHLQIFHHHFRHHSFHPPDLLFAFIFFSIMFSCHCCRRQPGCSSPATLRVRIGISVSRFVRRLHFRTQTPAARPASEAAPVGRVKTTNVRVPSPESRAIMHTIRNHGAPTYPPPQTKWFSSFLSTFGSSLAEIVAAQLSCVFGPPPAADVGFYPTAAGFRWMH